MKKQLLVLFCTLYSLTNDAQTNCNAGFESPVFVDAANLPANTAFAIQVTATNAGTLTDISIWNTGLALVNVRMAVYDDNAGVPGNLIANTTTIALTSTPGAVTGSVTPAVVTPGNYFLAAVIDAPGNPIATDAMTNMSVFGMALPFSSSFPASGSGFSPLPGSPVNIWMNITCATAIEEWGASGSLTIVGFPMPIANNYTMNITSTQVQDLFLALYNCNGQKMSTRTMHVLAGENTMTIPFEDLENGIYFLRITNENEVPLWKQQVIIAR